MRVLVKNWICRYGVPNSIHSDQERNFESQVFEEMCHLLNINKTGSTAYHPEGNERAYEIVERVTDVTYRVQKARGHSRKSQVVHFNNLWLYKRGQEGQEGSIKETGSRKAVDSTQEGNEAGEQVQTTLEEVVSMEPDIVTSGTEEEVVWVAARSEGYNEVADMSEGSASGDPSYLVESNKKIKKISVIGTLTARPLQGGCMTVVPWLS